MADPQRPQRLLSSQTDDRDPSQLHFYPGEKRLLFLVGIKVVLDIEAWGGPQMPLPRGPNEKFGPAPTTPGRFRIGSIGPYLTNTWGFSRLPWGVPIKDDPHNPKDLLYEANPGRWKSVYKKTGLSRNEVLGRHRDLKGPSADPPDRWIFNDFGPAAIRYYQDKNDNHVQDKNERLSGEMFHTTPEGEAGTGQTLGTSHGCIHLWPLDKATWFNAHAFEVGTLLVIHRYEDVSLVPRRSRVPR
jgi:hypothetical protein